jgi:hypothetical protein
MLVCGLIVGPNDLDPKDTGFEPPRSWGHQLYKIPRLNITIMTHVILRMYSGEEVTL